VHHFAITLNTVAVSLKVVLGGALEDGDLASGRVSFAEGPHDDATMIEISHVDTALTDVSKVRLMFHRSGGLPSAGGTVYRLKRRSNRINIKGVWVRASPIIGSRLLDQQALILFVVIIRRDMLDFWVAASHVSRLSAFHIRRVK